MTEPDPTAVTQLTPLLFLERSAEVFSGKTAVSYGDRRLTYRELAATVTRTARALMASGVGPGDRVAYLLPNLPEMLIAHFAVPLTHGVLVAINTRLSGGEMRYILEHSGASLLVADSELLGVVAPHLEGLDTLRTVVSLNETGREHDPATIDYEDFLARGDETPIPFRVDDEHRPISINYTSGTTGRPKGVLYTHRGAYLNALAEILHSHHTPRSVYLWTLPMFHCNGWCTPWALTGIGGTHVCLRAVDPGMVWKLIEEEGVTHLNAAPTVLISLANHPQAAPFPGKFTVTTAGAPPSPTIIGQLEELGAEVVHVYGLTETYGPYTVCEVQDAWSEQPLDRRVKLLARQGVAYLGADPIRVVDEMMSDVPRDGVTMGEVVMRGNNVMAGYYNDPAATAHAFRGGWFHSGDLAVWHPDGYIELRDRQKDIIISGGENISTIEVEQAIVSHPAVLECAVVAMPHEHWGERPKAFVVLKPGAESTGADLIQHVRSRIAHFKAPDEVDIVESLPKTSTGKIQKFVLREQVWAGEGKRIN
ncbi:MAG TPA: acyl--CoA ligase family protein [Acidimicrobiia bacterium]|nr:acyl--CoA ligase family protein [Acidimicrobiia bacterium]